MRYLTIALAVVAGLGLALIAMTLPLAAQSADPALLTPSFLEEAWEALAPSLFLFIDKLAIPVLIGWLMLYLPAPLRTYVEKNHREAFHSALRTGAQRALEGNFDTDQAVQEILRYVQGSVPDAIGYFRPTVAQLRDMALAKLTAERAELTLGIADLREAGL